MIQPTAAQLERFCDALEWLAAVRGTAALREVVTRRDLPERGVYFFFDAHEARGSSDQLRVVRVGTHALKRGARSTLRQRLRQHLGTRVGHGNHRGSVFRLHVGAALLERDKVRLPTWGVGSSAPAEVRQVERAHEARVSQYLGDLRVVTLGVTDEAGPGSLRGYVERNAIALLSTVGCEVDPPSMGWLGRKARRASIRASGLWNVNHVGATMDETFLERFEEIVAEVSTHQS